MTMNRVQFQSGLSMAEFMDRYGRDDQCEAALVESRWPSGFACPACDGGQHSSFRREGRLYFQCTACRHQCSVISGTIFESTKLALSRWFLAMHLLTQSKNNVAALELMRHLGVCYKTAWLIKHKLMEVMRVREEDRQLDGRVEIDDAYLGGERSGGKVGRGSENKVPSVAAVQTTPDGQPQFVCLRQQPFTNEAVAIFAAQSIAPTATVVSDGLWCFGAVQLIGADHERVVTGGGKASAALPQFKAVNTFLGNLKRALGGTYHAFDFAKYAHRYLAEAQYRFNRRFNLCSILARLLRAACLTSPTPAAVIRAAEVGR
ncbi:MAG: IS1595 family transposase [Gammaproteobacteria bacterium]|mgnify:CR=1 FL=1|nr:MAG: IS1595 family transposase [Burkholderiaceae bacterium]